MLNMQEGNQRFEHTRTDWKFSLLRTRKPDNMKLPGSTEASVELCDHAFMSSLPLGNQRPTAHIPSNSKAQIPVPNKSRKLLAFLFSCLGFLWVSFFIGFPVHGAMFFNLGLMAHSLPLRDIRRHKPALGNNSNYFQEQIKISVHALGNAEITLQQFPYSEARLKVSQTASYLLINNYL